MRNAIEGLREGLTRAKDAQGKEAIRRGVEDGHVFRQYVGFPYKEIAALLEELGIEKKRPVHAVRHSFASFVLKSGWPVGQLAKWLGHADISTTYSTPGI